MRGDQMQTIITYNEHEATESNDLLKSLEIDGNKGRSGGGGLF